MSAHLQNQIDRLKDKILTVGTMVEEALSKAIMALVDRDAQLAQRVIDADDDIDRMEVEVEEECLKTLALYQPVAADLRFVVAVLKINNDLERMGDLAGNIAKRAAFLAAAEPLALPRELSPMASKAKSMLKRSLDALVNWNAALARQVRSDDDEVDELRAEIRQALTRKVQSAPERTEALLKLLSVSKHLERLADMATNIAEDVIYMVEGVIVRHRIEP